MSESPRVDRRRFLQIASLTTVGLVAGCSDSPVELSPTLVPLPRFPGGRLSVTPTTPTQSATPGLQPLGLASPRDGLRYVPSSYSPDKPIPLLVLLHGAAGNSANWFGSYDERAEEAGCAVLAIDSRDTEWDLIAAAAYGDDLAFLETALTDTFDRVAIDPTRMAIGGFSIGASYALGVGLTNGDLFGHVIAYAPVEFFGVDQHGMPRVFVSHGRRDPAPIELSSRPFVAQLRAAGYEVEFVEFDGGHAVPQRISDRAFDWLAETWDR